MPTYAIYQDTPAGRIRIGPFRGPRGSVREVSRAFYRRYPHASGTYLVASRWRVDGRWADREPVPLEPREAANRPRGPFTR